MRDERGIDLAMMAFIGARLGGETTEVAARNATAMLEMFGLKPSESDGACSQDTAQRAEASNG